MPLRFLTAGLLLAACVLPARTAWSDARIRRLAAQTGWLSDYQRGLAEARKTGKPIFLLFRCEP